MPMNDPDGLLELASPGHDGPAALVRETERIVRNALTDRPSVDGLTPALPEHVAATWERPGDRLVFHDLEQYQPEPARPRGGYVVYDAPSFIETVARMGQAQTTLWAEQPSTGATRPQITAVLNDAGDSEDVGWRDHRVTLQVRQDPDWLAWANIDAAGDPELRRGLSQVAFAEFINDHLHNLTGEGAGATLLHAITTFSTNRKVTVRQDISLTTGEISMILVEEEEAVDRVKLPTTINLNLRPFYGAGLVPLTVQLRYRWDKSNGVRFGLVRVRPDIAEDAAWQDVCTQVRSGLEEHGHPLLQGSPPAPLL